MKLTISYNMLLKIQPMTVKTRNYLVPVKDLLCYYNFISISIMLEYQSSTTPNYLLI